MSKANLEQFSLLRAALNGLLTYFVEQFVTLQKDPLTNLVLVLYAVALAAVPVLVPYGKAGVKGCDFVVIIHVHILLCVHVEFFTLKIMHSNVRCRILRPCGICGHFSL